MRPLVLWVVWFWAANTAAHGQAIKERVFPETLKQSICSGGFDFRRFWAAKIFDVQIEGSRLRTETGSKLPLTVSDLKLKASALAKVKKFHGFSFGLCAGESAWIAAIPSASELVTRAKLLKAADTGCEGVLNGYWVNSTGGSSKPLVKKGEAFELPAGVSGYYSLECQGPKVSVAQEYFLGPFGASSAELPVPFAISAKQSDLRVFGWLSELRRKEGLMPVFRRNELEVSARELAVRREVQHDPEALAETAKRLSKSGMTLLGENRVHAASLEDALILLWISPRHRDLLLNPEASYFDLVVDESKDGAFIAMLAAKAMAAH